MYDKNSRIIKFRVWDRTNKQWLPKSDGCADYSFTQYKNSPFSVFGISPECLVIQQFTGLLDKNGAEIYEGDIVKYFIKYNDGEVRYECINEVTFTKGSFAPIPVSDIIDGDEWYSTYYEEYEIIGNIFENPELLNK